MRLFYTTFLILISSMSFAKMSYKEISSAYRQSYQYEKAQNYMDAIKAVQIVQYNYPKTYTVNLRMAYLYLQLGKYANSTDHYKKAQLALPDSISPKLGQMSIFIARQMFSKAETVGFNILKSDPNNFYGNLKMAYVLLMLKKYEASTKMTNKMLTLYPENVLFQSQLAHIYVVQKIYSAATEVYQNILILDPENFTAKQYFSIAKSK